MNVSTSSAAATASTSDVSSTQSKSKTSSTSKTTEKSFDEEMKTASEKEEVKEKDTNKEANKLSKDLQNPDDIVPDDIYKGGINFTDYKYHNEGQSILSQNIQNLLNTKDLMNTIN